MKKRSNLTVMMRLIGLVKPLTGYMILAVLLGIIGFLCAIFITIFGGWALLDAMHMESPVPMTAAFAIAISIAVVRGFLRYGEQACNHYIAFKLLALIRDHVFKALRKLCPAKLEGKGKGNLISVITSDIAYHFSYFNCIFRVRYYGWLYHEHSLGAGTGGIVSILGCWRSSTDGCIQNEWRYRKSIS